MSHRAARSKRLLALDPGESRIGVAISDELGLFAHTRPAISGRDLGVAITAVAAIVDSEGVGEVIVGLPLTLDGRLAAQAERARAFADALASALTVPVLTRDERLTTVEAAHGRPRRLRRDGSLDSAAAAVLLQSALDARRGGAAG